MGSVAGLADVGLIIVADPTANVWVLLEALLFWCVAGWVVAFSDTGLGRYGHGVVVTLLLNLPWYVLLGPAAGTPEHVLPLVIMSVAFGAFFGWARGFMPSSALPA